MKARVLAKGRGATPVEVQKNVEKLSTYEFPEVVRKGFEAMVLDTFTNAVLGKFPNREAAEAEVARLHEVHGKERNGTDRFEVVGG